ncbi:MAG: MFS transporter [Ilumatobacteraceae bacterium]
MEPLPLASVEEAKGSQMFRSLRERNAKLFFAGLAVSNVGTWLQATAQVLLVRRLGGNGLALGIVTACQFLPMLVIGLWAGALADRFDRRHLTIITQAAMGVQAIALGILDLTDVVTIPVVYALSLALGIIGAIDNPARRGLATELVERRHLTNVMSLNTSVMTGSRIFGPALAALFANVMGTGWCFVINGVSFLALLWALVAIDPGRLYRGLPAPASATPIRDGLRAVWADPVLRLTVIVYAVVSTFAFNYAVSIPLLIRDQLDAPDTLFGWILSTTSIGSVIGALMVARLDIVRMRLLFGSVLVTALSMAVMAFSTSRILTFAVAVPFGAGVAAFIAASNAVFAERTSPDMRGRVLALGAVLFLGSTPIGAPITGWIGDHVSATWSMLYGALIALVTLFVAGLYAARNHPSRLARRPIPTIG